MRFFLMVSVIFLTHSAWGWGTQGHMVVGQVAQNNLSPFAKKAVNNLLNGATLPEVANWADHVKGDAEWTHTKPWHFVDIPDGEDYSTVEHSHDGDVVVAITEMIQVLKNTKSSAIEKENALKFIVHFVGDIHQPLHVGRPDDRGGNSTKVIFEGRPSNLHALWDTLLIMKTPMNYIQYADSLETKSQAATYDLPEISFSKIISECMGARDAIYDMGALRNGPIVISSGYYKKNLALMNAQLLSGGKRLAEILNKIYVK